jgi:hypothetical protein
VLSCFEDVTAVVQEYNLEVVNPLQTQAMAIDELLPQA